MNGESTSAGDPAAMRDHLSLLGHELRTPLNAILGFTSLLRDELEGQPAQSEKLDIIIGHAQHLLQMIDGVLECARAGDGRLAPAPVPCSPWQLAGEVVRSMSGMAAGKGLAIALDAVAEVPASLITDPLLLRQILLNLLGNAVRYTREGGVRLSLGMAVDDGRRILRFSVNDTGQGMSSDQMQRLFQPYERAGRGREAGSSGLGLWISRQLARLLGGSIRVASAPDAGSAFRLDLPCDAVDADLLTPSALPALSWAAPGKASARASGQFAGLRALVVDDVETNQLLLSVLFKRHGASVAIAADGQAGVHMASASERDGRPFDLVLMDIRMPRMDGCAATRALRAIGYPRPIIACSANMDRDDRTAYADVGFDGFLAKPVTIEAFAHEIGEALRRRRTPAGG